MKKLKLRLPVLWLMILFSGCAEHSPRSDGASFVKVPTELWAGDNAKKINLFLQTYRDKNAVAIFDWDNTVAKNDIGDATFFWLLRNDGVRHPASFAKQNPYLTAEAVQDLNRYCPGKPGSFLNTSENKSCADTLLSIYLDGKTKSGKRDAWKLTHPDTLEPAYLWVVQFLSGYTPAEVKAMAEIVIEHAMNNSVGTTQFVGSREVPAYVHVYDAQKQLIQAMKVDGFDVWIATASAQGLVELFAAQVGIQPDHVIGVRSVLDASGKLTDRLEGCGPYPDGNIEILTYRQGKRCFINKLVYKLTDPKAQMESKSPTAFAAGDSDTDVFFVKDAKFHLVINRNKPELMCNAFENKDQHWIVNPMFLLPKPKKQVPYACARFGILDQVDAP